MVYSVPVNGPSEVSELAAAGAGELYCSLQEPWWIERYGDHDSISRRQGRANLGSREELAATAAAARKHGLPLLLALNGQYDEHQLDYLVELAHDFELMGGTGLIARDLGLLLRLQESGSGLKRVCSLLAPCANAASVIAYARFGVSRVVFPRFLGPGEIEDILRASAREGVRMEAESMLFFDKCPLVDGYCTHYHGVGYPDRMGKDAELPGRPLYTFDTTYRTHACLGKSCDYLEPYPCAACEVARFERGGVSFGKLGGRGRPLEERVRALRFLRDTEGLAHDEERRRLYEQTFGQACACYYGSAIQDRTAIEPIRAAGEHGRGYVGDVRDGTKLRASIQKLREVEGPCTLFVGPLPQSELEPERWEATIELLCRALLDGQPVGGNVRLCANDVGTLMMLAQELGRIEGKLGPDWHGRLCVTAGPLLTRGDKPAEFDHFLLAEENPPRPIWDLEGRPRVLTYQEPPHLLRDHWQNRTSYAARTSYQRALARIAGRPVSAEF